MKTKSILSIALTLTLAACATTAEFERQMNTWVGKSDSELIGSYGNPIQTIKLPNGDHSLVYASQRLVQHDAQWSSSNSANGSSSANWKKGSDKWSNTSNSTSTSTYTPASQELKQCTVRFTVHLHKVIAAAHSGNDCVATKPLM